MNEWELNNELSEETKIKLFNELKKKLKMTTEETNDFINRELRGSFLDVIDYLR